MLILMQIVCFAFFKESTSLLLFLEMKKDDKSSFDALRTALLITAAGVLDLAIMLMIAKGRIPDTCILSDAVIMFVVSVIALARFIGGKVYEDNDKRADRGQFKD